MFRTLNTKIAVMMKSKVQTFTWLAGVCPLELAEGNNTKLGNVII
jgi:hypothetical protein